MSAQPVIEVQDLRKSFGQVPALRDVSLAVAPGATGLVGPNGAGKTTLIKLLLGLLSPDAGRASVLGLDPASDGKRIRSRVGLVPEDDCYWEGLSAVGSIQYAGRLSGLRSSEALKRAHVLLDRIGLGEDRYRPVETFSIGMRQKVRLAQAIVHEPELLILDEPTRFLDPRARQDLAEWLQELKRRGVSIFVSSHEISEIERVCESVTILSQGKLAAQGLIADLTRQANSWVIQPIGPPEPAVDALRQKYPSVELHVDEIIVRLEGDDCTILIDSLEKQGISVRSARKAKLSLDELMPSIMSNSKR